MNWKESMVALGFGGDTPMTRGAIDMALHKYKNLVVESARAKDDKTTANLTQVHEALKKAGRKVCHCGHRKRIDAGLCPTCQLRKTGPLQLVNDGVSYAYEIPELLGRESIIRNKLKLLDRIGASIELKSSRASIFTHMKKLNLKCELRKVGQKTFRVWRTDGKSMETVNEIIRANLNGEQRQAV